MRDRNSVMSLLWRLAALKGLGPWHLAAAAAALALPLAFGARCQGPRPARAPPDRPALRDPDLVETPSGWLLSYTRRTARTSEVWVASLGRDGQVVAHRRVFEARANTGWARLARVGDRVIVVALGEDAFQRSVLRRAVLDGEGRPVEGVEAPAPERAVFVRAIASHGEEAALVVEHFIEGRAALWFLDRNAVRVRARPIEAPHRADQYALAPHGDAWLLFSAQRADETLHGRLSVTRLRADGAPLGAQTLRTFEGVAGSMAAHARGAATALVWLEDSGFVARGEPYFLRLDEGRLTAPPVRLGPRQNTSPRALWCGLTGCSITWLEAPPAPDTQRHWMLLRTDPDGHPFASPLRLPCSSEVTLQQMPVMVGASDQQRGLAVIEANGVLLAQGLDAEGRPVGAPRRIDAPATAE
ncbi:MAG: hypothetical protein JNK72_04420 [Myxococcales bacterium]|nr:hypothetical protein [Myxococcales bacterium]